jgi:hypothetical protein
MGGFSRSSSLRSPEPVPVSAHSGDDRGRKFLIVDEHWHWFVFNESDAIGEFATWEAANAFARNGGKANSDDTPTWQPKSGGY